MRARTVLCDGCRSDHAAQARASIEVLADANSQAVERFMALDVLVKAARAMVYPAPRRGGIPTGAESDPDPWRTW